MILIIFEVLNKIEGIKSIYSKKKLILKTQSKKRILKTQLAIQLIDLLSVIYTNAGKSVGRSHLGRTTRRDKDRKHFFIFVFPSFKNPFS